MMLLVWWSTAGIVHLSLAARGQTSTAESYGAELQQTHRTLLQKQPALVNRHGVLLLQDPARSPVAQRTMLI
ncbi:hypothetical protein JGB54_23410 [Salmonella enterica subsp. enterica serovar Agona]|nr:hypothetical protein [Salmonella enterica subsp. enterica serovar Agona]